MVLNSATELPLRLDLTMVQGATFRRTFRYRPGGIPQDFTGWAARMQIRQKISSPQPYLSLNSVTPHPNSRIVLTSDGLVSIYITDLDTSSVPTSGYYDLELIDPTYSPPDVIRLLKGRMRLDLEVTKDPLTQPLDT